MQGAGNDFVVVDATRTPFKPTPDLLARLADRRFGVGCDQILVIEPAQESGVDFNYRIYNADGSEVGQCGNGSRCLARFIRDHRLSAKDMIRVRTQTSVLDLYLLDDGEVRVNMGVPNLEPAQVPFIGATARAPRYALTPDGSARVEFAAVSMGNPHAVIEVVDVEHEPVERIGRALQADTAFPESVNVGFLQIIDERNVTLRVYERGAGETLACGSGACAAVVAGRLWSRLAEQVNVRVRGGMLRIEWAGEGQPVWMTGPAVAVFTGEIEWSS